MIESLKSTNKSASGISPFQAFAMPLGNRVGVGALAGVATASAYGGSGSIFWIWVYTLLGSCSAFAKSVLG